MDRKTRFISNNLNRSSFPSDLQNPRHKHISRIALGLGSARSEARDWERFSILSLSSTEDSTPSRSPFPTHDLRCHSLSPKLERIQRNGYDIRIPRPWFTPTQLERHKRMFPCVVLWYHTGGNFFHQAAPTELICSDVSCCGVLKRDVVILMVFNEELWNDENFSAVGTPSS